MYHFIEKRNLLDDIKFIYYPLQDSYQLSPTSDLVFGRVDFYKKYNFDTDVECSWKYGSAKFAASHSSRKVFKDLNLIKGFFDVAYKTIVGRYEIIEFYDLPILQASVFWSKKFVCPLVKYHQKFCCNRICHISKLPSALKDIKGQGKCQEWERLVGLCKQTQSGKHHYFDLK